MFVIWLLKLVTPDVNPDKDDIIKSFTEGNQRTATFRIVSNFVDEYRYVVGEGRQPARPPGEPTIQKDIKPNEEWTHIRHISIPKGFTGALEISMKNEFTGDEHFPDLNVVAPNKKDTYGHQGLYLRKSGRCSSNSKEQPKSCESCTYTGYRTPEEVMRFINPIEGKWIVRAYNVGNSKSARVTVQCKQLH